MNKERPILFSGPMVRAILEGRKTQTRRIMKPQPPEIFSYERCSPKPICPYGKSGDHLWVRETWTCVGYDETRDQILGAAGPPDEPWWAERPQGQKSMFTDRWKPSIHMPRWASRITLEVVSVRVERLQDIREDDARAEGVGEGPQEGWVTGPVVAFADLWDSINGQDAWLANPWVWVVEFKRL